MNDLSVNLPKGAASPADTIRVRLTTNVFTVKNSDIVNIAYRLFVEVLDDDGNFIAYLDVTPLGIAKRGVFANLKSARHEARLITEKHGWNYIEDLPAD